MMAEVPAARPSIPSVKFAPFDTAVIIKIAAKMNIIHAYFSNPGLIHSNQDPHNLNSLSFNKWNSGFS